MLRYFGDEDAAAEVLAHAAETGTGCGNCGNCLTEYEVEDMTEAARAVMAFVAARPGRFGKSLVADVLHGGKTQRIFELHLDCLLYTSIGWRSHPRHMRRSLSKPSKICSRFCRMSIGNRSITSGYRLAARFALPVLPNVRSARCV